MARLRVKNFGPITEGFDSDDGFIEFNKLTLFIGDQGTGKSTVAKLFSICSWLEKAFFRGDYDTDSFETLDFYEICRNQLLEDYFTEKTELEYAGKAYHFLFKKDAFFAEEMKNSINEYKRPKIMYIPSERNVLSVVKNIEELNNIPPMLRLLRRRYLQGSENLKGDGSFRLPLSGYKALVNKSSGETFVLEEKSGKSIPLICASSGLQSIVPSTLVTSYLSAMSRQNVLEKIRVLNDKVYENLKQSLINESTKSELERYMTSGISKSVSKESLSEIAKISNKYINSYFLNIVEEPEQNLFPESQMKNLAFLLEAANVNDENKILMTTHSPYVLSYITLAAKTYELGNKGVKEEYIEKIISAKSIIDGKEISIYETQPDGTIHRLEPYDDLPSDENLLNKTMAQGNELFSDLIDLEQEFCV